MKRFFSTSTVVVLAITITQFCATPAYSGKPNKPGGGGGSGTTAPYTLVDLGGFVGGDFVQAEANDVNNPDESEMMQVVGYSFVPIPGVRLADAAIWDVTAEGQILALTDIAPVTLEHSGGRKVNDLGYVLVADLLWVPGTGYVTLPGLGGGTGISRLMNDLGNVYGGALDGDGVEHAVVWQVSSNGQVSNPVDLGKVSPDGHLGGFYWQDVNNNDVFAGRLSTGKAAIAWFEEGVLQIQNLGALLPEGRAGALCINDNGMVAGEAFYNGLTDGFMWTAEAGMVSLGSFNGLGSRVKDINNQGQIVGWSRSDGQFGQVAFVWQNGQMFDLNKITDGGGGKNWIQIANGINDVGHIVGLLHKTKPLSENHGFLLVPTSGQ